MADELSYVLITSYSLRKSRTGGIIARLLSRTGLELVGSRLFSPSKELAMAYAEVAAGPDDPKHHDTQEQIRKYVRKNFLPGADGTPARVLLLVLRGEDAVLKTRTVTGQIVADRVRGETIRDTYGDCIEDDGKVVYFEPAVLAAPDATSAREHLALWGRHAGADGGLLESSAIFPAGKNIETTLVLIKPDNFCCPSSRVGGVIDIFSRSGLTMVGFKVHHMSVAEASEFYAPVREVLRDKMRGPSGKRVRLAAESDLGISLTDEAESQFAEILGPIAGQARWEALVQFMSGTRPSEYPNSQRDQPGTEKSLAIVYRGIDAVEKMRELLGPTDPAKALPGTIRREFGRSMMVNAAHASDSPENARREMAILRVAENNLKPLLEAHGLSV